MSALVIVLLLAVAGVAGFFIGEESSAGAQVCSEAGVTVLVGDVPAVSGFTTEQVENAGHVLAAAADLDVPRRGQQIAVMTALGESGLRVLDHGDTVGPDSRGLFQQRDNGAWGSYADRMDPRTSAASFYRALLNVPGWELLEPTIAAHRTQRNANPWHYERYWPDATRIVGAFEALDQPARTAVPATAQAVPPADGQSAADRLGRAPCAGELSTGAVGGQGWANPATGRLTSPFGYRIHPITGQHHLHTGSDVANACGTPVHAAADGVVIWQGAGGYQGRTGNQVVIDHDGTGSVLTRYGHVLTGTILVGVGEDVAAGQQIASIGGDPVLDPRGAGGSTGCHLHFEVNLLGIPTDARAHLASHGVELGS